MCGRETTVKQTKTADDPLRNIEREFWLLSYHSLSPTDDLYRVNLRYNQEPGSTYINASFLDVSSVFSSCLMAIANVNDTQ